MKYQKLQALTDNSNLQNHFDYILVGHGIAGAVLAQTLIKHQKKILVIDSPSYSKSSKVAAGLYNPIVFKRLVKSWFADELIPFLTTFYTELEEKSQTTFHFKKEILKLFSEENEMAFWVKKSSADEEKYLNPTIEKGISNANIKKHHGAGIVLNAGNIDCVKFLNISEAYLRKTNGYVDDFFDFGLLEINKKNIAYKHYTANKIIFCEGYRVIENPYFKGLPMKLTKGETITIQTKIPIIDKKYVLNKGVFILNLYGNTYKIGATYEWENLNELATEKGKDELVEKLQKIISVPFEILNHEAGIRPTVVDRRPILGLHSDYKNIGIFNGMGTKAVMIAPYFAQHFIEHLEQELPLDSEVDVKRFYSKS